MWGARPALIKFSPEVREPRAREKVPGWWHAADVPDQPARTAVITRGRTPRAPSALPGAAPGLSPCHVFVTSTRNRRSFVSLIYQLPLAFS